MSGLRGGRPEPGRSEKGPAWGQPPSHPEAPRAEQSSRVTWALPLPPVCWPALEGALSTDIRPPPRKG